MEKREQLYQLLGDLPPRGGAVSGELLWTEERTGYILEKLALNLNGEEPVPAYFVKPKVKREVKHEVKHEVEENFPVILFCHSHGGKYHLGKDELIHGNTYMFVPPYADALTAAGYAALCIDSPIFGERHGRDELDYFKETLWQGKVLWGLMVYDHLRAIDYLFTRADINANRLAAVGMSMGSTMSWWLTALDERIKVVADICCMTDFQTLIDKGGLKGHGIFYYVPGLLKHFDTISINALIAPRPHLSVNGAEDELTPEEGLDKVDRALKEIYAPVAPDAWQLKKYPVKHVETAEMRGDVMTFLDKWL